MSVKGPHHLIGYAWRDDHLIIRARPWPQLERVVEIDIVGSLKFRLLEQEQCIGYFDFETKERHACPDKAVAKKNQCEDCMDREGFAPWLRCDGREIPQLPPAVRAYVESPHHLYLACFGDENVKVGMASDIRKRERLLDQGPLAACYVASADGITIRQMEVEISRLGYTEFMRRSRKVKLLTEGMSPERAKQRLAEAFEHIRGQLDDPYSKHLASEPEAYRHPDCALEARSFNSLEVIEPTPEQIIDGKVLAASGSIAVLDEGGIRACVDMGPLVGKVLDMNPDGEVEREAKQIGLF